MIIFVSCYNIECLTYKLRLAKIAHDHAQSASAPSPSQFTKIMHVQPQHLLRDRKQPHESLDKLPRILLGILLRHPPTHLLQPNKPRLLTHPLLQVYHKLLQLCDESMLYGSGISISE